MATYLNGNVRRATPNTIAAMRRSAAARQCPACERKSAMSRFDEGIVAGAVCRWCGHVVARRRGDAGPDREPA